MRLKLEEIRVVASFNKSAITFKSRLVKNKKNKSYNAKQFLNNFYMILSNSSVRAILQCFIIYPHFLFLTPMK